MTIGLASPNKHLLPTASDFPPLLEILRPNDCISLFIFKVWASGIFLYCFTFQSLTSYTIQVSFVIMKNLIITLDYVTWKALLCFQQYLISVVEL